jgi:UDP-glucose 4-epimerase
MKILVTGGAGYVGSHCNRYLADQGIETVVLDNLSYGRAESVIAGRLVVGDCGDRKLLDELMTEEKFDAIFHFAAIANIPESLSDPALYYECNVTQMKELLDAAVRHKIMNFIFSSSAATYGIVDKIPVEETDPLKPINPYGTTKLIGEMMLADYEMAYGLRYCAFRYFNVAGASSDGLLGETDVTGNHVLPVILRAAIKNTSMEVFGNDYNTRDGTCLRDYVHVEDLVEAHYLGLKYLQNGGKSDCFNLGSNSGFTVLEMIKFAEEVVGHDISFKYAGRRLGDSPVLVASNGKAKEILGWNPTKSDTKRMLTDAYRWESNRKY